MKVVRIYTDDEGTSRLEPIDPDALEPLPASRAFIKTFAAGTFLDRHPAPRRMTVVVLSGELEQGLSDGTVHRFDPGDVRLLEDTTGEGHTTRIVSDEDVVLLVVPYGDDG